MNLATNWRRLHRSSTVVLAAVTAVYETVQASSGAISTLIGERPAAALSVLLPLLIGALRYWRQASVAEAATPPTA